MGSLRVMGWISILVALAILGMGGAPIAEKFEIHWLDLGLRGIAYVSVALLAVATLAVGGLGLYHGILTVLGQEVGTVSKPSALSSGPRSDSAQP